MNSFQLRTKGAGAMFSCVLICTSACIALSGCASTPGTGEDAAEASPRIIRQMDRPLQPAADGSDSRTFAGDLGRGTLTGSGQWQLRAEITHDRLRCASYAPGVRFGVGNATCTEVDWQGEMQWAPARPQCNAATLVQSPSGRLDLPPEQLGALNCARVAIRCRGACG